MEKYYTFEKIEKGITIEKFLKHFSKNYISNLKQNPIGVLVNKKPEKLNYTLKENDVLSILKEPKITTTSVIKTNIPLDIVYEDDDILAVNKPSNISTIPSKRHFETSLAGMVLNNQSISTFRAINRLDKEASGIVLIAKNSFISESLSNSIIEKTYYAIVENIIEKEIVIEKNIETLTDQQGKNILKRVISENGKKAITHVSPIETKNNMTLCKIQITHGRTHQIRLHLSSVGHALVGDWLYGKKSTLISRTALHLGEIAICHPLTKKQIKIIAQIPDDMKKCMKD